MKIKNDIDGLIILDKEKNMTSNDCLMILKKVLHVDKIGHIGTLDPNATGVLICLVGRATKSQEYLMRTGDKVYSAEIVFGISTDTEDITGNIINISDDLNEKINTLKKESFNKENQESRSIIDEKIENIKNKFSNVIDSFIGEYEQVPPMYSAKKIEGKKLVDLARKGKIVERKPSKVNINSIVLNDIKYECKSIKGMNAKLYVGRIIVNCGKGTYIRTLCKDIGDAMGIPTCMGELRRTRVFNFDIKDSIKINEIKEKVEKNDYSFIKPCYYRGDNTVLTFGKFETLHLGHMKIIENVVKYAREGQYKSVAMIVGDNVDNQVLTKEQRISKFKYLGIDDIINFKLNEINKKISPEEFVKDILINQLKAKMIIVGSDCSFGYKGMGDARLLKNLCKESNVDVIAIDKLKIMGTNDDISSTFIKSEYDKGNKELVAKLLGK